MERRKGKVDKRRTNEWGLDREWRGGRESVDKREKKKVRWIGSGEAEGKRWIREGKSERGRIGNGEDEGKIG